MCFRVSHNSFYCMCKGFFKSMRYQYINPSSSVHYYCVTWDRTRQNKYLSFAEFNKMIGRDDPYESDLESLRGLLLENYKILGVNFEPRYTANVTVIQHMWYNHIFFIISFLDNFIHASSSSFEAMVDRKRWVKLPLTQGTSRL